MTVRAGRIGELRGVLPQRDRREARAFRWRWLWRLVAFVVGVAVGGAL